ncbi:alpha/beta hydrolase [Mycolicibacterium stellerae]|uniref:alpha/beta hydrolase n=1 Tax=Mycolicibacterium stellerae TaxID=2358193 RepID=UPI0019D21262|nr:alpha/beta hydrolase [Mycolicibacterium stellerae]
MSIHPAVVRVALRACRPLLASRRVTVGGKRRMYDLFTRVARVPTGTGYDGITIAGVPVEGVRPAGVDPAGATLLYLHGGAYALGSAKGYRGVVARLADAAGMTALVPDYSRSPEARYPVALEEMVGVYQSLIACGVGPERLVIVGDSAGGGLALSLAMALRDRGIPSPAAVGLICPWADLAIDIDGGRPKTRDPLINPSMAAEWVPRYVGEQCPRQPGISPAHGDMAGLPPIVLHSAGDDPLCIDADRIEKAAAEAGAVEHRRFDDLWHDFHLQAGVLAEADEAINDMGARLRTLMTEKAAVK